MPGSQTSGFAGTKQIQIHSKSFDKEDRIIIITARSEIIPSVY